MDMKIGVLSDTHITRRADKFPQKVIEILSSVDAIIHAGDYQDKIHVSPKKKAWLLESQAFLLLILPKRSFPPYRQYRPAKLARFHFHYPWTTGLRELPQVRRRHPLP